jgi:sugar lactone lactonase YvrE
MSSAALRLIYNVAGSLALVLAALGMAVSARAQVITLNTETFPVTQVGTSVTQAVVLNSSDDLTFNTIQIDPSNTEFTLAGPYSFPGTCFITMTVAAGGACTINVTFTPKLPGWSSASAPISRSAPLTINYWDSDLNIGTTSNFALTGTGTGPVAAMSPGLITDIVGNDAPATLPATAYAGDYGPASGAVFNSPAAMAVDSLGNIYIADTQNDLVRVIYKGGTQLSNLIALEYGGASPPTAGYVYTIAGEAAYAGTPASGADGVLATLTQLANPQGVAVDAAGNVYISDTGNCAVRMINASTGIINTVAGTLGSCGYSGDNGSATGAQLNSPAGISVDGFGDIFIADNQNNAVRVVNSGLGESALYNLIPAVTSGAISSAGLYAGYIYTVAGGTYCGTVIGGGDGDGALATQADICAPTDVTVDSQGNLFISDTGDNAVRRVDAVTGLISTVSVGGQTPAGLAVDASDNLYYGTSNSCTVYEYNAQTKTSIAVAGGSSCGAWGDGGSATAAGLSGAQAVTVDGAGNLYILEPDGVRFVNATATSIAFPYAQFGIQAPAQTVLIEDADIVNYAIGAPYLSTTTALAEITGTTGLTVASPFLVVAPAPAYSGTGATTADCGTAAMNLTPGLTCGIGLTVQASSNTTYTAAVTYPENGINGAQLNFSLSATVGGTAPAVSLTGGPLTFYAVPGGAASATQPLTLTNLGTTAAISITSIAATSGFAQTNNCGSRLAANGSCTINVSYTATGLNPQTGWLQITDNSSTTNGIQSVALTGNGAYPTATLTGGPLTFTAVVNESASAVQTLTLTNTSSVVPLTVTSITPPEYTPTNGFEQLPTSTCGAAFPITLPAGQSCSINFDFATSTTGTFTQMVTVTDNANGGATQTTQLTGTEGAPIATITQPATQEINFGSLLPGTTSAAMPVIIQNTGTVPLTFCMAYPACMLNASAGTSGVPFQIVGVVADQYYVDGSACLAVAPLAVGASCTLNVYFKPTFAGRLNATLDINDDSGGAMLRVGRYSTQTVTLNGVGNVPVGGSTFTIANATQFLAAVGQTQTQTVTLTLNNAVALNPMTIQSGFTEYSLGGVTGCAVDGITINPAGTICQIPVTFAPVSPGIRTAPLIVTTTENGGTPYVFGLSGTGSGSLAVLTPGIITQFVGGYLGTTYTGIGGPASQAGVGYLEGIAVDSANNVFLSDEGNNTIWRIDGVSGIINYYAGGPWPDYGPSFTDGNTAIDSNIAEVGPLALDAADRLYLGDSDGYDTGLEGPASGHNLIRVIDPVNNIITSVAGNGVAGWPSHARLYPGAVIQVAISSVNYLFTVQQGGVTGPTAPTFPALVGKTVQDGTVVWINSGKGTTPGFGCPGQTDSIGDGCTGLNALLPYAPVGLVLDQAGNIYFSDGTMVRRIDAATGIVTIYAGNGTPGHTGDGGQATAAEISGGDLAFDSSGNLYIAEAAAVRMVAGPSSQTPGVITTVAGTGTRNPGNNQGGTVCAGGSGDGGPATAAEFSGLTGIAFDAADDLYLTDGSACRIRRVDAGTHTIVTVAGAGGGYLYGPASAANDGNLGDGLDGGDGNAFGAALPQAIFTRLDGMGNMYIAEFTDGVRKINVSQSVMDYNFVYAPNYMYGVDSNVPIDTQAGTPLTTTVLNAGNNGVLNFKKPFTDSPWGINSANWTRDITGPTGSADCYDTRKIGVGYECPINTGFTPLVAGSPLTGTTTVNDDAVNTPQTITLIGSATGTPADVTLLPFLLSFSTPQNSSSAPQTLTLFNHNATAVTVSISLAGVNMADFSMDASQCPATLAANTGCPINVSFNPPLLGGGNADNAPPPDILKAQVVVLDSDTNTPKLVSNLIGIGTLPAAAATIPLPITETIHVSDASTVVVPTPLTIIENVQLSDAPTIIVPTPLTIIENIQLSDAEPPVSAWLPLQLPILEMIHVSDTLPSVALAQQLPILESIHVSDALTSLTPSLLLPISEQIHVTDSVSLLKRLLAQTITFTDSLPASAPYSAGLSYTLSANGGASGNPVIFSATGPATVNGNALSINGWGTVVVAANQAGNDNYAAAPQVTQSINIIQAGPPVAAKLSSPTSGATLAASGQTFMWNPVAGATGYTLWLGSSAGTGNLYDGHTAGNTLTVSNLPVNGSTIYARLITNFSGGTYAYSDTTYTAVSPAALSSPSSGATLAASGQVFSWAPVAGATGYTLWLGSSAGTGNLYDGHTAGTTLTVSNLPVNGSTIYARLITNFSGGTYAYTSTTFTAVSPATLSTPSSGATLAASGQVFTWNPAAGATGYTLWLGSSAGTGNLYDGHTAGTTLTSNSLPVNGSTIYARLITNFNGVYAYTETTYVAK